MNKVPDWDAALRRKTIIDGIITIPPYLRGLFRGQIMLKPGV